MPKKKIEIVHWTQEEEQLIAESIPSIKQESGKYKLSTRSKAYKALQKKIKGRSVMALNVKVRSMMDEQEPPLFKFEEPIENWEPDMPLSQAVDRVLKEYYGQVSFENFIAIQNKLNQFA